MTMFQVKSRRRDEVYSIFNYTDDRNCDDGNLTVTAITSGIS